MLYRDVLCKSKNFIQKIFLSFRYDVVAKMSSFGVDTQYILEEGGLDHHLQVEWKHTTGKVMNISSSKSHKKILILDKFFVAHSLKTFFFKSMNANIKSFLHYMKYGLRGY